MSKQFSDLGINEKLQKSLADLKISVPTDIQKKCIPVVLNKKEDLVVLAKTGTGKTAAFGLPLIQLIDTKNTAVQAVILAPTRFPYSDNFYSGSMWWYSYKTSNRTLKNSYACSGSNTWAFSRFSKA